jgi:cellobiose phosphorylase
MLGDGDKAGELFSLLNPINHTNTRAGVHRYQVLARWFYCRVIRSHVLGLGEDRSVLL